MENIYPVEHLILQRQDKEKLLQQRSLVVWLTGLSGSGKTTLARHLEAALNEKKFLTQVLDGDNIRSGINKNLGFSEADRLENIRRIAEVSYLFMNCGVITINSFVSPTKTIRNMARQIIGRDNMFEVYVNTPLEVCEERDIKGLYKKARRGEIKDFTGIDAPFEDVENADLTIDTSKISVEEGLQLILNQLLPRLKY